MFDLVNIYTSSYPAVLKKKTKIRLIFQSVRALLTCLMPLKRIHPDNRHHRY